MQITVWSPTMIDADNDGVNGGPGDYQRIAAVRIAVVARGKNVEKPAPGGSAAPPRWRRPCSATVPSGVTAAPMRSTWRWPATRSAGSAIATACSRPSCPSLIPSTGHETLTYQRGIALPIMLIMLAVMMVSSIYLLKSSTSTTLTTSNLAYEAALTKAADAGLHAGFTYLRTIPNKNLLLTDQAAAGYVATLPQTWTVSNPNFWLGAITMPADATATGCST
jgi:hypothetical protein